MKKTRTSSYANGRKRQINRRNPLTEYWMMEEIYAHDCRLIFPDWSYIARRGMEARRRDNSAHYKRNRLRALRQKKEYRQRPEVKAREAARNRAKAKSDPATRARHNLSRRLHELLFDTENPKSGRSVLRFIGCSGDQLRLHLERQFGRGMSWENYGNEWQIDHVLPCASFDHTDPEQVAKCWHWSNLRPLRSKANAAKKDKITEPQMALLLPFH
jgi:hypothetical protein